MMTDLNAARLYAAAVSIQCARAAAASDRCCIAASEREFKDAYDEMRQALRTANETIVIMHREAVRAPAPVQVD